MYVGTFSTHVRSSYNLTMLPSCLNVLCYHNFVWGIWKFHQFSLQLFSELMHNVQFIASSSFNKMHFSRILRSLMVHLDVTCGLTVIFRFRSVPFSPQSKFFLSETSIATSVLLPMPWKTSSKELKPGWTPTFNFENSMFHSGNGNGNKCLDGCDRDWNTWFHELIMFIDFEGFIFWNYHGDKGTETYLWEDLPRSFGEMYSAFLPLELLPSSLSAKFAAYSDWLSETFCPFRTGRKQIENTVANIISGESCFRVYFLWSVLW